MSESDNPVRRALIRLIDLGHGTIRHGSDLLRQADTGFAETDDEALRLSLVLQELADAMAMRGRARH